MNGGSGDMFLMVKGAKHGLIKGESQDDQHKGEIEVTSWSWGMEGRRSLGGDQAAGKSAMHDLKIVKRVDSASTALMLALRSNEEIKQAILTVRKAGKQPLEYLKIIIEDGRVTSLTVEGGDPAGGPDVVERVSFSFNQVEVQYVPQAPDGRPQGAMLFADQWRSL